MVQAVKCKVCAPTVEDKCDVEHKNEYLIPVVVFLIADLPLYGTGTVPFKFRSCFFAPFEKTCMKGEKTISLPRRIS